MAATTEPRFLYPQSRQFSFDEVTEQIVRALEERNWNVPGITVDFDVCGTGYEKYRMVRNIRGDDFKLWFCRPQARMGRWNDTAAVTEILIPKKELHVYEDESGPTLYIYVGRSWQNDRDRFINGSKVNSKLHSEPRTYLKYKGACNCRATAGVSFEAFSFITATIMGDGKRLAEMSHTHPGMRSPYLIADNDLGREYYPEGKEPEVYVTEDVYAEFTQWLKANVLVQILAQSVAKKKINIFKESVTPYLSHHGPIFCFGGAKDAVRVFSGRTNPEELDASDHYGFTGGGYRLMSLGTANDGTVPEIAYDGFKWCTYGEVDVQTPIHTLVVPGHYRWPDRERFVFRITPNHADGLYIADHAAYEKRRTELLEEIKPRDHLTESEMAEADRAQARTIIPITEYAGGFEQPVILINRVLDIDEVELVSGPWPECQYVQLVANRSEKSRRLLEATIVKYPWPNCIEEYHNAYNKTMSMIMKMFKDDDDFAKAAEEYSIRTFHKSEVESHFSKRIIQAADEMRSLGLFW